MGVAAAGRREWWVCLSTRLPRFASYILYSLVVGLSGLAAVEDPVDEVEDGEDDGKALARQLVDASRVVLAVVRLSLIHI